MNVRSVLVSCFAVLAFSIAIPGNIGLLLPMALLQHSAMSEEAKSWLSIIGFIFGVLWGFSFFGKGLFKRSTYE